jgi:hypothetical protein
MKIPDPMPTHCKRQQVYGNDKIFFAVLKDKIEEGRKALRELGLTLLAKAIDKMIAAPVSHENNKLFTILLQPHYLCGFMRTDRPLTHAEQVHYRKTYNPDLSKSQLPRLVKERWEDLVYRFYTQKNNIRTEADFLRMAPGLLTTKSAGMGSVAVDLITRSALPRSREVYVMVNGKKVKRYSTRFTFSDKTTLFFADPWRYLRKEYFDPVREDLPWKIGNRDVQGKPSRAIFVVKLRFFLFDGYFIPSISRIIARQDETIDHPLKGNHCYTMNKEIGRPMIDHFWGMWASSNPTIMQKETDFSKFDATQDPVIARDPKIEGFKAAAIRANVAEEEFLGYKSALEAFIEMQKERRTSYFQTNKASPVHEVEMTLSGELDTSLSNSVVNLANADAFFEKFLENPKLHQAFKLLRWMVLGDDAAIFWLTNTLYYSQETHEMMVKMFTDVTNTNGLKINDWKTVFRIWYYEYLKKHSVYGYFVPLYMQTDVLVAENPAYVNLTPVELCRSVHSTCNVMIGRGWGRHLMHSYFLSFWNLKRAYVDRSYTGRHRDYDLWIRLPFMSLSVPPEDGGVGAFLDETLFASKNGLIMFDAYQKPELYEWINAACFVMKVRPPNTKRAIAQRLLEGEVTNPKLFFQSGLDYVKKHVWIPERLKMAQVANEGLRRNGLTVPKETYTRFPEYLMSTVLEGNPRLGQIDAEVRSTLGNLYMDRVQAYNGADVIGESYGWMKPLKVEWLEIDEEEVYDICPYSCIDPIYQRLYRIVGYARDKDFIELNAERIFSIIHRDPHAPKYITSDRLYTILSAPNVIHNPDFIMLKLLSLGIRKQTAGQVLKRIVDKGLAYRMMRDAIIMSVGDNLLGQLDFSEKTYRRFVKFISTGDKIVDAVLQNLGMGYVIYNYVRTGRMRKLRLSYDDLGRSEILGFLTGKKKFYRSLRHLKLFD